MRFLVDECTGPAVARWLRERSHEVFSIYDSARGEQGHQAVGVEKHRVIQRQRHAARVPPAHPLRGDQTIDSEDVRTLTAL
ncbi:MAG: hypothetical protein EBT03_09105 [Betaproteobacteria bacterium]|nr:hypothetical protein [Betaproteobacteria bacterium]NCA17574.1 hypothetical protein [Betaproteobacteria bacterium]